MEVLVPHTFHFKFATGLISKNRGLLNLKRLLLLQVILLPHLSKLRTARNNFLSLQPCLYDIQWVCYQTSKSSSNSCTEKVPQMRALCVPGLDISFQVFINCYNHHGKRNVHSNSDWVGSVQAFEALIIDNLLKCRCGTQVAAKLKSLLDH